MWLTKKLERLADKLDVRGKARKKELKVVAEVMRDRDLSPTEREKLIKDVNREFGRAFERSAFAFRVVFTSLSLSALAFALLYIYYRHTWALHVVAVPLSLSFGLFLVILLQAWVVKEMYVDVWKHLGIQVEEPPTPEPIPPISRPNTENPPPIKQEFGLTQAIACVFIFILFTIPMLAVLVYVKNIAAIILLLALISIPEFYALESVVKEKRGEPIPLVSWRSEFKTGGHTIELAFQMPGEYNTPQTQERIGIATRAILRNFNAETLQDTLETGLFKDVSELRIPVFRIQILAIDKVAGPVPEPVKEKSVYI
jgi:hypothetical protein